MLSKKNLVFQKNQTIATLNVHFSSTQSPGCLSIQRILFRGEDNSGSGRWILRTGATSWLGAFSLAPRELLGWGLPCPAMGLASSKLRRSAGAGCTWCLSHRAPALLGLPAGQPPGWGHTCECGEVWCCCAIFVGPVPLLSPVHAACTGWRRTQSSLGRDTHPLVTAVLVPAATGCTQVRKQSEIRAREKASESTPPRQGRSLPVRLLSSREALAKMSVPHPCTCPLPSQERGQLGAQSKRTHGSALSPVPCPAARPGTPPPPRLPAVLPESHTRASPGSPFELL